MDPRVAGYGTDVAARSTQGREVHNGQSPRHSERDRGREAERPGEIPAGGWKDILVRTAKQVKADDVSTQAAAITFYSVLALFPALIALVSIYGLLADPNEVRSQLESFVAAMPEDAGDLITKQLGTIAEQPSGGLGLGRIIGVAAAVWTASSGVKALIKGLNVAYDETETRRFFTVRAPRTRVHAHRRPGRGGDAGVGGRAPRRA